MYEALLELCSQRLIRYEALPAEADVPALQFLNEDLDTVPDRHAFLGNYARFCREIVDAIVYKQPLEALQYILGKTDKVLENIHNGQSQFNGLIVSIINRTCLTFDSAKL
jgi:exportin-5